MELEKKRKYRILVVDDSATNVEYLVSILKNDDYIISSANNGSTALIKAKGNSFDLILLDVVMEGLSGFDVCLELKSNSFTKDVPIIFLTSRTSLEDITKGFEYGAVDYVKKPFNVSELKARVQTHLELKRSKDTIADKNKQLAEYNKELEKLSIVASRTSNSVIITNNKGDIEWINEGFCRLTGYSYDDIISLQRTNIRDWSGNKEIDDVIKQCGTNKHSVTFAAVMVTKSGKGRWVQTNLTPIINAKGDVVKMVAIDSDITEIKRAEQEIKKANEELALEKKRSDELLLNVLPFETAEELKRTGKASPKQYDLTTILFTDFINFSKIAENITPELLVSNLDEYFVKFDSIISKYNLEKIKTIGDAYMCAGGIPAANKSNPFTVVLVGLEIQKYMKELRIKTEITDNPSWKLRLGIHSGDLVTGVVGEKKFAYDIWGDSVNTASRIESAGEAEKVNISGSTFNIIKDYFNCSYRGKIKVKNKGEIDMYFVNRIIPEFSADKEGLEPNEKFLKFLKSLDLPVFDTAKNTTKGLLAG